MKIKEYIFLFFIVFSSPAYSATETITSTEIISSSGSLACLNYKIIGLCFWYVYPNSIKVSLKVGHYNPDLVVSAYNRVGENPWNEANGIEASAGSIYAALSGGVAQGGGMDRISGAGTTNKKSHKDLIFKEVAAIGNPSLIAPIFASSTGYICPSQAFPLYPYILSSSDAVSWRYGLPESLYPQALIPGVREIGSFPSYTWGAVYPRSGFVTQTSPSKAAAVVAQRASDIVTRTYQPHVYTPVPSGPSMGSNGMKVWEPAGIKEGDPKTGTWQMLTPIKESSCSAFGTNDLASTAGWGGGKVSKSGRYSWNLWRPYKCCEVKGAFLYSVDFMAYP